MDTGPLIKKILTSCYTIPTETPESDGTLSWKKTTLVLVEAMAGDEVGVGYSYADVATGKLVESLLADELSGRNAFDVPGLGPIAHDLHDAIQAGLVEHSEWADWNLYPHPASVDVLEGCSTIADSKWCSVRTSHLPLESELTWSRGKRVRRVLASYRSFL
jgi:hypothetical protein